MRKKVLFVIPEYSIGGTNTSLENLLTLLNKDRYELSVFCLYEDGSQYYKKFFKPYILKKSTLYYLLHDHVLFRKIMGALQKISHKVSFDWLYRREAQILQDKYGFSTVVGFQECTATEFASYFKTVRKIAWFHSPYISFLTNDLEKWRKIYDQFDAVACVSKVFASDFVKVYPNLEGRVHCVYNTLDDKLITSLSNFPILDSNFDTSFFTIVSLGRFCPQKQFEKIPMLVDKLHKIGNVKTIRWYIIASGSQCRNVTMANIEKYHLEEEVIILKAKDNPYPYIRHADLVVCTSDSESFSYVINEGKILHTPVISNNFPVAKEVLPSDCGWISSLEDMPDMLFNIINDVDGIYSKVKETISNYTYPNNQIIEKVNQIL